MEHNLNKIAILGTGDAGRTLGNAWKGKGYEVIYGSRDPENRLDKNSNVFTYQEAIDLSEIIVNTIPGELVIDFLKTIRVHSLDNKIFLDVSVPLSDDNNLIYIEESGAEKVQKLLPKTKVVKTLCTMTASIMVNPSLINNQTTVFLSGDDKNAKRIVRNLLKSLGWSDESQLDLGGVSTAKGQEHFASLYFPLVDSLGTGNFNIKVYSTD